MFIVESDILCQKHYVHKFYYDIDLTHYRPHTPAVHSTRDITVRIGTDTGLSASTHDESWGFSDLEILVDTHVHDITIDADYDSEGDGTLTVASDAMIESNGRSLMITAADIDLQGSISVANSLMSVHGASTDQTIGLGVMHTPAPMMTLTDDELGRITALAGLSVGSSHTGDITVGGITVSNSDMFGTLRLMATKPSKSVKFKSAQSDFSKGIVVLAQGGVHLEESVST